jgi:SprB repeat
MLTKIFKLFVPVGLLFFSYTSYGQLPAFSIQNVKGACEGFSNGSIEVLVTSATGSVNVFYFGPAVGGPFAATIGIPLPLTGLASSGIPYLIVVQDNNGAANTNVTILSYPTLLTGTVDTVVPNTDCNNSNGSISITPSGGSGPPNYTFSWTGPNGFTSTSEDITGLLGGNYSVTISTLIVRRRCHLSLLVILHLSSSILQIPPLLMFVPGLIGS